MQFTKWFSDMTEQTLQERVEQLENAVEQLRQRLDTQVPQKTPVTPGQPVRSASTTQHQQVPPAAAPAALSKRRDPNAPVRDARYWLRMIGVGLLLFGAVFLFKYSEDEGRSIMSLRVVIGFFLGLALASGGLRLHARERHFSQVLSGGGIGVWYVTGFAAYQLFHLISHPVAFGFMAFVTIYAFAIAVRQSAAALAVIGVLGGLGTPFLLYAAGTGSAGTVAYTCLVLSGAMAIYFYRGWRSLLWTGFVGGWGGFLASYIREIGTVDTPAVADKWVLQIGIIFGLLLFAAFPVIRERLSVADPDRWPRPYPKFMVKPETKALKNATDHHVHLMSVLVPFLALALTAGIWSLSKESTGHIALSCAAVYALATLQLRRDIYIRALGTTHTLVTAMLISLGFCLVLDGNWFVFALATQAAALHWIAYRLSDRVITVWAHVVFVFVGMVVLGRTANLKSIGVVVVNSQSMTDFWTIFVGALSSLILRTRNERYVYRYAAHGLVLLWVLRELSTFSNGQGIATIVWGIYAAGLLVGGLRKDVSKLRNTGLVTLFIVVGKLFLVDLTNVKAIWRILLFLGFGGGFLALSYYFQKLRKSDPTPENETPLPTTIHDDN